MDLSETLTSLLKIATGNGCCKDTLWRTVDSRSDVLKKALNRLVERSDDVRRKVESSDLHLDEIRKRREQDFHDARHTAQRDPRVSTRPFYTIVKDSHAHYRALIYRNCAGSRVLEYGCGPGSEGFELARRSARVDGIDISPAAVNVAAIKASSENLQGVQFAVMDAENTNFENEAFDLVAGSGILHHLDLERAYGEIARVLKPDGRAVFIEPLGHNPLINWYRHRTPELRTADEHPLLVRDLEHAKKHFKQLSVRYFHLSTLAAVLFRKTFIFKPLTQALAAFDNVIFATLPFLRRYAWMCVLEMSAKKENNLKTRPGRSANRLIGAP